MNLNSPVYREEMAHKTQEINKTYKAQKAHESVQTLKPPHHGASSSHTGSLGTQLQMMLWRHFQ